MFIRVLGWLALLARSDAAKDVEMAAMTYNNPLILLEYAVYVADACRAHAIKAVAVTAGYVGEQARRELFDHVDARHATC